MKIEDGKGKNGDASVSTVQRLNVSAKIRDRMFYASRDFGLAYTAIYDDIEAAAGDYVAYLKNDSSTRNLFINDVTFGGVNDAKWKIFNVSGTAASGEPVTPVGMNLSKNIPAEATAMAGDTAITGLTVIKQIGVHYTSTYNDAKAQAHASTILGPNDALAIEYDVGTTGQVAIEIHFHYEDIGAG